MGPGKNVLAIALVVVLACISLGVRTETPRGSRKISYRNISGQEIARLTITVGEQKHEFVNLPDESMSMIYGYGWGDLEGEVSGILADGTSFGPRRFTIPMVVMMANRTIKIEPGGRIGLYGDFEASK